MSITPLTSTNTFNQWLQTTNSIINEVNGITVYNIIAGDGISISPLSTNVFAIGHANTVATGVTFTGPVRFANSVAVSSLINIASNVYEYSPKVSGLTAGNLVKITSSGLTFAKADTKENAELFGMISGETSTKNLVTLYGMVDTTSFADIFSNALNYAGATLIANQAYFLDPVRAGGITTNEPNVYGQVSKPVILGLTGNAGLLLHYRGVVLEGITAGITAELDNKLIVSFKYTTYKNDQSKTTGNPIKIGDFFLQFSDFTILNNLATPQAWYPNLKFIGDINNSNSNQCIIPDFAAGFMSYETLTYDCCVGIISKIISHDTINDIYILEITLPGGSFVTPINELDDTFYTIKDKSTTFYLEQTLGLQENDGSFIDLKFLQFIRINDLPSNDGNVKIIYSADQPQVVSIAAHTATIRSANAEDSALQSQSGAAIEYDNLIPNGSFAVWQRGITHQTHTSITGDSRSYFADRWFIDTIRPQITGLTASIQRVLVDSNQSLIGGSPFYYVDSRFQYLNSGDETYRPKLENIQRDARLLQGQTVTASFWAKATATGVSLDIFYNMYNENTTGVTYAAARVICGSGVTLSTAWKEYVKTFAIGYNGFTMSPSERGWFSFGFEFPSSGETLSIAQVQMDIGDSVSPAMFMPREKELEKCKPYYLRSYSIDETTGSSNYGEPMLSTAAKLQLGNLNTQNIYSIQLPIEMVRTPDNSTIYDWSTGQTGDVYIKNISTRASQSASKYQGLPWQTSSILRTPVIAGSDNLLVTSNKNNIILYNLSGAFVSLDTIVFHYVVDADIQKE